MEENRFFLEVAFRGTNYHGWQIQSNANSVQATLEQALETLLRKPTPITGCGRTDTGVHALQHFSHFDAVEEDFQEPFIHQMNSILPEDIVVKNIFRVSNKAHARFDAISRTYHYRLYFQKNPFKKGISTFCPYLPDLNRMQLMAEILKEYSNFSCFSKSHTQVKTDICTIMKTEWEWIEDELVFTISADRFLRNMVRAIVGTLLMVGWDEMNETEFRDLVESGNRANAGVSVSPDGLYLKEVLYPYSFPESKIFPRTKSRRSSL